MQVAYAVVGEQVRGSVETGRWYDIRVEVRGRTVRGFLDGQLVQDRTLPRIDKVLAVAGRDDQTGDIIVKAVNSAPEAAAMNISMNGARVAGGTVTVLTGPDPLSENSFDAPALIVPKTSPLTATPSAIAHTFPPYSLTILRLKAAR